MRVDSIDGFMEKYKVSEFTIDYDKESYANRIEETASNVNMTLPIGEFYSLVYRLQQHEDEKKLRATHRALDEAFKQYQTLLKLCTP